MATRISVSPTPPPRACSRRPRRDFTPAEKFSLRASAANIPLGEKIYFRVMKRDPAAVLRDVPLTVSQNGAESGRTTLTAADQAPDKLAGESLPAKSGRTKPARSSPTARKRPRASSPSRTTPSAPK